MMMIHCVIMSAFTASEEFSLLACSQLKGKVHMKMRIHRHNRHYINIFSYINYRIYTLQAVSRHTGAAAVVVLF